MSVPTTGWRSCGRPRSTSSSPISGCWRRGGGRPPQPQQPPERAGPRARVWSSPPWFSPAAPWVPSRTCPTVSCLPPCSLTSGCRGRPGPGGILGRRHPGARTTGAGRPRTSAAGADCRRGRRGCRQGLPAAPGGSCRVRRGRPPVHVGHGGRSQGGHAQPRQPDRPTYVRCSASPRSCEPTTWAWWRCRLFHVFGLNVALGLSLATGAALVLDVVSTPRSRSDRSQELGVTTLLGVPTMFAAWADAR